MRQRSLPAIGNDVIPKHTDNFCFCKSNNPTRQHSLHDHTHATSTSTQEELETITNTPKQYGPHPQPKDPGVAHLHGRIAGDGLRVPQSLPPRTAPAEEAAEVGRGGHGGGHGGGTLLFLIERQHQCHRAKS